MKHRVRTVLAGVAVTSAVLASGAVAHPGHGERGAADFGDVAEPTAKQHDGEDGHLAPVSYGVDVIGKGEVSLPPAPPTAT